MVTPVKKVKQILRWYSTAAPLNDDQLYPIQDIIYSNKVGPGTNWFPYGYHASPPPSTDGLLLNLGSSPSDKVLLPGSPLDRRKGDPLKQGEVILYQPTSNSRIHFLDSGKIETVATTEIIIKSTGTTIGNGTEDIVSLMSEMCQLVSDSAVDHSGSRPMDGATKAAWAVLKSRVDDLKGSGF